MKIKKQNHRTKFLAASLALALTSLALSTAAGASTPTPAPSFKSGFYLGAQAGYSQMKGKIKETLAQQVSTAFAPSESRSSTAKKNAPIIELLGGYRHFFSNGFMVGGELAAGYSGQIISSQNFRYYDGKIANEILFKTDVKRTYFATPSFVIGKVFTPHLLGFLKLGLGISKFKSLVRNVTENNSFKGRKTQIGFVPTLGLEYAVSPKISILGSVSYEIYRNVKKTIPGALAADTPGTSHYTFSTKPKFLTFKIGFILKT